MAGLDEVKQAQNHVFDLQERGVDLTSPEARRAMNHLFTLLRQVPPDQLAVFDCWKVEEQQRRARRKT